MAANAGGAWSPIGDVTTTMLWIRHKISTTGKWGDGPVKGLALKNAVVFGMKQKGNLQTVRKQQFIHFMGFTSSLDELNPFFASPLSPFPGFFLLKSACVTRHHYLALFPFLCGGGAAIVWHLVAGHQGNRCITSSVAVGLWLAELRPRDVHQQRLRKRRESRGP